MPPIQKIKRFFGLSFALAKADFKLRNEGSYLGILWYLLNPIFSFLLLFLIFSSLLGKDIPFYSLYLLIGIIMFNFFQDVTLESTKMIREYSYIIKSINFPKEVFVSTSVIKRLFSHLFEIIVFIAIVYFVKGEITGIIFYPFILLFFCLFIFGVGLILSSLAVFIFDIDNVWNFIVRLIWLGTPIFYAIGKNSNLYIINLFNPMYYFITLTREVIIYTRLPDTLIVAGAIIYSLAFFAIGLLIYRKLKNTFSEMI